MSSQIRILFMENEERIRNLVKTHIEGEGFILDDVQNSEDGIRMAIKTNYDVVLLDMMISKKNGLEVCKAIRKVKATPIIIISSIKEESTRIKSFELGVDDYILKPFSPRELILRIKALIRRSNTTKNLLVKTQKKDSILYNDLLINLQSQSISIKNNKVNLTPKEYQLLLFLASSPDKLFSREELLKSVWKYDYFGDARTVDTHIKRIRKKVNKFSNSTSSMIVTVWGFGYKFQPPTTEH